MDVRRKEIPHPVELRLEALKRDVQLLELCSVTARWPEQYGIGRLGHDLEDRPLGAELDVSSEGVYRVKLTVPHLETHAPPRDDIPGACDDFVDVSAHLCRLILGHVQSV